ncbi:MAG: RIP metalloprotease RseP [candidate division Zixibacteria bacterium]|nr:RIP metalloprotease RseP [candidate division Zixibacteria bacterium]
MLITILSAVFVLGLLVFVHELGHFLAAKRMGIKVERFSLGFPPKMIGKTVGDTEYCISWVPLGGYVKMAGEHPDSEDMKGEPWEFQSKSLSARAFVIAAGPMMNFLLAFVVFWIFLTFVGVALIDTTTIGRVNGGSPYDAAGLTVSDRITQIAGKPVTTWDEVQKGFAESTLSRFSVRYARAGVETTTTVDFGTLSDPAARLKGLDYFRASTVSTVLSGSPAERADLRPGDTIVSVDGQPITQWYEMVNMIKTRPGIETVIAWRRDGKPFEASIVPDIADDVNPENGEMMKVGRIGITQEDHLHMSPVGPIEAIQYAGLQVVGVSWTIITFVKKLVSREVSTDTVGGPLAIAKMAGESAQRGAGSLFGFMAFLSINLAILNLLPIPALDGGQLLILGVEGLIRRPLSLRQRLIWQQTGMALLLVIMVFVLYNDVSRILR